MNILNNKKRWTKAQHSEKSAYLNNDADRLHIGFDKLSKTAIQQLSVALNEMTGCSVNELNGKTLLEIGGVDYSGFAAYMVTGINAIALDPLINLYQRHFIDNCRYIQGIAEDIKLEDKTVDYCICRNAIDHMINPNKALKEMGRVLKSDGKLYISCNVFNEWAKPLFPVFNLVDTPHPHHYSGQTFLDLLQQNGYQIDYEWPSKKTDYENVKIKIANLFGLKHKAYFCSITLLDNIVFLTKYTS
jgi:SAM-dependent methyltransferase